MRLRVTWLLTTFVLVLGSLANFGEVIAEEPPQLSTAAGATLLAVYFEQQTSAITDRSLSEIETLSDWTDRRDEYRRQLLEMLGLDPFPERSPLEPVITGIVEADDFVVERSQWTSDERGQTQIRRRFMLIGQTLATMQIYDVRRTLQSLESIDETRGRERELVARGNAAMWALYASLYEANIKQLTLTDLPVRNRDAPDLLMVSRYVEIPHTVMLVANTVMLVANRGTPITLRSDASASNHWQAVLQDSAVAKSVRVSEYQEGPTHSRTRASD